MKKTDKFKKAGGTAFKDFYEEISDDWQEKARRLQARRWHKIQSQNSAWL